MPKSKNYEEFVEKFKSKLTTDDCYTPENIYQAVKDWAVKEMDFGGRTVVRPFWPGGDYEHYDYPKDCVVIDNPPFSIISKIAKFYEAQGIDYFLFAPHLTCLGIRAAKSHVCIGVTVTYDNGARVRTSFIASKGPVVRSAPTLYQLLNEANAENLKLKRPPLPPVYSYPDSVLTSQAVALMSQYGIEYQENIGVFVRALDHQKEKGKGIFGSGYIVPQEAAREAKEAVKEAQEAARQAQEARRQAQEANAVRWGLSARELEALAAAEAAAK